MSMGPLPFSPQPLYSLNTQNIIAQHIFPAQQSENNSLFDLAEAQPLTLYSPLPLGPDSPSHSFNPPIDQPTNTTLHLKQTKTNGFVKNLPSQKEAPPLHELSTALLNNTSQLSANPSSDQPTTHSFSLNEFPPLTAHPPIVQKPTSWGPTPNHSHTAATSLISSQKEKIEQSNTSKHLHQTELDLTISLKSLKPPLVWEARLPLATRRLPILASLNSVMVNT